jgi:hypothetical protein
MCNKTNSKTTKVSWILISILQVYDAFYFGILPLYANVGDCNLICTNVMYVIF